MPGSYTARAVKNSIMCSVPSRASPSHDACGSRVDIRACGNLEQPVDPSQRRLVRWLAWLVGCNWFWIGNWSGRREDVNHDKKPLLLLLLLLLHADFGIRIVSWKVLILIILIMFVVFLFCSHNGLMGGSEGPHPCIAALIMRLLLYFFISFSPRRSPVDD